MSHGIKMTAEETAKIVNYMKKTGLPNRQVAARFGIGLGLVQNLRNKYYRESVGDPKFRGTKGRWWGGGDHAQF